MNLLSHLLPDGPRLRLETWNLDPGHSAITLTLQARRITACCPLCGRRSKRVHSRYKRTLADLPWGAYAVTIRLRVRRLFCRNAGCERRIFAERLPGIALPWARRTRRLDAHLTALGLALGGSAGVRLGAKLGLAVSRNTLLRRVRQTPVPSAMIPSALGVDDWALRKRVTYGTILVDLERRRPVALLPDREADTLAEWLRAHPGVAVIARDRAGAYAKGARIGAPEAVQVADRFHLLQNLAEMLEVVFTIHTKALRAVDQARREAMGKNGHLVLPPAERQKRVGFLAGARHERRKAQHERVWVLHRQGWPGDRIGPRLGVSRSTVYRHLRSEAFPERRTRRDAGCSQLDPWQSVVAEHWNDGRRNGRTLLRELQRLGYRGSYATLMRYLRRFQALRGSAVPDSASAKPRPVLVAVAPRRELTPRSAAWTVLRRRERRSTQDQELLVDLRRYDPELNEAITLAEEFVALVRGREPERLDPWLLRAQDGSVMSLRRFAKRLSADYEAVRAAVKLGWSNGPVEGQINRLKMLKRTMYGRADLDLLSRRFLLAA
jgi:transposase